MEGVCAWREGKSHLDEGRPLGECSWVESYSLDVICWVWVFVRQASGLAGGEEVVGVKMRVCSGEGVLAECLKVVVEPLMCSWSGIRISFHVCLLSWSCSVSR